MSIKSGFFNSVNNDRLYDAGRYSEYFASFIGNGVFPNPSTNLQVVANNDMTVTIKAGKAWINGYILINDSDYTLSIDVADGVLKRVDRIVLKLDTTLNRAIDINIKKGIFASTPTPQELQRDADAYEIALADIAVNNGAIQISQSNITDLRQNSAFCGIVTGTVDQIDASGLFAQYDQAFNSWLQGLENILDENTAGNLLNLINANTDGILELKVATGDLSMIRLNKDANDLYTEVQFKRIDNTLYKKSVLSGGTSPKYTTRTVTYYATDGTTVTETQSYTLTYTGDDLTSEVIV